MCVSVRPAGFEGGTVGVIYHLGAIEGDPLHSSASFPVSAQSRMGFAVKAVKLKNERRLGWKSSM